MPRFSSSEHHHENVMQQISDSDTKMFKTQKWKLYSIEMLLNDFIEPYIQGEIEFCMYDQILVTYKN